MDAKQRRKRRQKWMWVWFTLGIIGLLLSIVVPLAVILTR